MKSVEEIALEEFKHVQDEGLFPNCTDKDIWVIGFKDGYEYFKKTILHRLHLTQLTLPENSKLIPVDAVVSLINSIGR